MDYFGRIFEKYFTYKNKFYYFIFNSNYLKLLFNNNNSEYKINGKQEYKKRKKLKIKNKIISQTYKLNH